MHDIHTHLYWQSYDTDRDEVVRRAREAGVEKMLVIGCTVDESRQCVALSEQYPGMYASVGVHPNEFNDLGFKIDDLRMKELRELAQNKKVVAIGECGLEYYTHETNNNQQRTISEEQKIVQKQGFLAQIELAQELGLALILHCRPSVGTQDSYEDLFKILQSKIINLKSVVLHCYMGDTEVTKQFLTLPNVFFSFTGNITYPIKKAVVGTKDDLTETVKLIPLNRIFAETDCPFLTPQSHRGERNEPAYVAEVLECIARLHGVEPKAVEQLTESNFKKVFPMVQ